MSRLDLRRKPLRRWWLAPILACITIVVPACTIGPARYSMDDSVRAGENIAVNANQLRIKFRSILGPLTGEIVASADRIIDSTDDHGVRRAAILWKIDAVPALREALYQPNPYVAGMDTWVLTFQMIDYFESGPGKEALGDAAPIAVATCRHLEAEVHRAIAKMSITGDVPNARKFARKWASEHPIPRSIAGRPSTLTRVKERDVAAAFSTTEVVAHVAITIDDLNRRIEVYSAQVLDQARWQAELFAMELGHQYELARAMPLAEQALQTAEKATRSADRAAAAAENATAVVNRLAPQVEKAMATVTDLPRVVAEERTAVLAALETSLARERAAALKALNADIENTTNFMHDERIAALDHLSQERGALTRDLRELVAAERAASVDAAAEVSRDAVEHAFRRAAQLAGAVVLAVLLALAVALVVLTRAIRSRG